MDNYHDPPTICPQSVDEEKENGRKKKRTEI